MRCVCVRQLFATQCNCSSFRETISSLARQRVGCRRRRRSSPVSFRPAAGSASPNYLFEERNATRSSATSLSCLLCPYLEENLTEETKRNLHLFISCNKDEHFTIFSFQALYFQKKYFCTPIKLNNSFIYVNFVGFILKNIFKILSTHRGAQRRLKV